MQSFLKNSLKMCIELKANFLKKIPKIVHWIKSKVSKKVAQKLCIEFKAKFLKNFPKIVHWIKRKISKEFS